MGSGKVLETLLHILQICLLQTPSAMRMKRVMLVIVLMLCVTLAAALDQENAKTASAFLAKRKPKRRDTCTNPNGTCENKGEYEECCGDNYKCEWIFVNTKGCRS